MEFAGGHEQYVGTIKKSGIDNCTASEGKGNLTSGSAVRGPCQNQSRGARGAEAVEWTAAAGVAGQ